MSLHLYMPTGAPDEVDQARWQQLFTIWQQQCQPDLDGAILVQFVSAHDMQELSRIHQGKDAPTDVLSFTYHPAMIDDTGQVVCGEIVICTDVALVNAEKLDVELKLEYATLFVHGLIHLAGSDHATAQDRQEFEDMTRGIMEAGGLSSVSLWLD